MDKDTFGLLILISFLMGFSMVTYIKQCAADGTTFGGFLMDVLLGIILGSAVLCWMVMFELVLIKG